MKPIKLVISAFGSYAGRTELDMEKLGDNGLYLVTGDTGAGKTTIFDAISYALFGKSSGEERDGDMLRSKYADTSTVTEVELTFLYDGKEYFVKRNPTQERPKLRGEGTTTLGAAAELKLPNGKVITKIADVDDELKGILGIDKNQFSQIAMLAQGDFRKFLKADTKSKRETLQKLFHTENYQKLEYRLADEFKKVWTENENLKKSISQYISDIACDENDENFISVEWAKKGDMLISDAIELIKKLIESDSSQYDECKKQEKSLSEEKDSILEKKGKAEHQIKAKKDSQDAESKIKELQPELETATKDFENATAKKESKEIEKILNTISDLNKEKETFEQIELKRKEISSNNEKLSQIILFVTELNKRDEELKAEKATLTEELKLYEGLDAEELKLKQKEDELSRKKSDINALSNALDDYNSSKTKLKTAHDAYDEKRSKANEKQEEHTRKYNAYINEQAGIIAATLEENAPCPVCGSVNHPNKAPKSENAPTKEQLEALEKECSAAETEANAAKSECDKLYAVVEEKKKALFDKTKSLFGEISSDAIKDKIDEENKAINEAVSALDEEKSALTKKRNRKQQVAEKLPQIDGAIEKNKNSVDEQKNEQTSIKTTIEVAEKDVEALKGKLKFASEEEVIEKIAEETKKKKELEKFIEDSEKAYNDCNQKLTGYNATIEASKKVLENAVDGDIEKLTLREGEINEALKLLSENTEAIFARLNKNKELLNNVSNKTDELSKVEEKYRWMKSLSDTAGGKISGKKISIETYVQMTYFERIIARASTRLLSMSKGQYEFRRRQESVGNKQIGLELDILDHHTNSLRDAKSLSGGESFMASLSLALGLSDEIQQSAGGIHLDSMFVDEGFGSLDSKTLESAMNALIQISDGNRIIGIISHVAELQERIDKQIIVKKDASGGSYAKLVY